METTLGKSKSRKPTLIQYEPTERRIKDRFRSTGIGFSINLSRPPSIFISQRNAGIATKQHS
jgi:hypothetical protein